MNNRTDLAKIRVLIVDNSAFMRNAHALARMIASDRTAIFRAREQPTLLRRGMQMTVESSPDSGATICLSDGSAGRGAYHQQTCSCSR